MSIKFLFLLIVFTSMVFILLRLISKLSSQFKPGDEEMTLRQKKQESKVREEEQARRSLADDLMKAGYFETAEESLIDEIIKNDAKFENIFDPRARRCVSFSARELKDGGCGEFLERLRPFLEGDLSVNLGPVEQEIDEHNRRYLVSINREITTLYDGKSARSRGVEAQVVGRFFRAVNALLVRGKRPERLLATGYGMAAFLTPDQRAALTRHAIDVGLTPPELFD